MQQVGYTIIEIALVLIVISLLLAGVLKGQQLIYSSQLRNLIEQSSAVHQAYYEFIDRFQSIPGDMSCTDAVTNIGSIISADNCATNIIGGDANGHIDNLAEASAVWAHLSAAQFIDGSYSGNASTVATYRAGVSSGDVAGNTFQGPLLIGQMFNYIEGDSTSDTKRLAYSFGGKVPVTLLRDLDRKLDDGVAGTGILRSASTNSEASVTMFEAIVEYTMTPDTKDCLNPANPNTWQVDSDNQSCNAILFID